MPYSNSEHCPCILYYPFYTFNMKKYFIALGLFFIFFTDVHAYQTLRDEGAYWNRHTRAFINYTATSTHSINSLLLKINTNFVNEQPDSELSFYVKIEQTSTSTYTPNLVDLSRTVELNQTDNTYYQFYFIDPVTFESGKNYLIWLVPYDATSEFMYAGIGKSLTGCDVQWSVHAVYDYIADDWSTTGTGSCGAPLLSWSQDTQYGTNFELYLSIPGFYQDDGSPCDLYATYTGNYACNNSTWQQNWDVYGTTTYAGTYGPNITTSVISYDINENRTDKAFVHLTSDMYDGYITWSDTVNEFGYTASGAATYLHYCAYNRESLNNLSYSTSSEAFTINQAACMTVTVGNGLSTSTTRAAQDAAPPGPDPRTQDEIYADSDGCGAVSFTADYLFCRAWAGARSVLTLWPFGYVTSPVIGYYEFASGLSTTSTSSHFVVSVDPNDFGLTTTNPGTEWDLNAMANHAVTLSPDIFDTIDYFLWTIFFIYLGYRVYSGAWYSGVDEGFRYLDRQNIHNRAENRTIAWRKRRGLPI